VAVGCIFDGNNRRPTIMYSSGRGRNTTDSVNRDHSDGTNMERWRNGNVTHSVICLRTSCSPPQNRRSGHSKAPIYKHNTSTHQTGYEPRSQVYKRYQSVRVLARVSTACDRWWCKLRFRCPRLFHTLSLHATLTLGRRASYTRCCSIPLLRTAISVIALA